MGEVKRYDIQIDNGCSEFDSPCIEQVPTVKGQWVEYSDYAALESTLSACEAECTSAVAERNAALLKHEALEAERDALRAEVAALKSEVEMFREELKRRCDEVAALKAAQANMIDATGAVEATVQHVGANQGVPECFHISVTVPAEWAGSPVKIVRKP